MAILLNSVDELSDERLRRLYGYWDEKRGSRRMPSRDDIDPVDLAFCLGYLCLIDVEGGDPLRFKFRVDGSNCVSISGMEMTGRYVDEIPLPDYRLVMETAYSQIYHTKAAHYYIDDEIWDDRRYRTEGILLPLSNDDD
ncbi:MAG TPA: PAS domain-containing protein, partial [Dongiaceae bacterium]